MIRVASKDDLKEITNLMLEGHDLHLKNRPDIFKGGKRMQKIMLKAFQKMDYLINMFI